ncbi:glycosyltransferase [Microbulbifer salipaludis]|uniref:Glycosyltransferase n=1 Tax=Microbulbifer salipaludis TaxID=187980 RepID=A0ABS3E2E4_9GAMM|nr:glycosyltransferase [Microbulbifer salipaludis]MBN8429465.1 glycosyltransferase [Microbulbifer salipaludis]
MSSEPNAIAYVAPEIPGPSSTFVYNEIIEVEKFGVQVFPFSLHSVDGVSTNKTVRYVAERCTYLYGIGLASLLTVNLLLFINRPVSYLSSMATCILDVAKCIARPRVALGLIYRFLVAGFLAREVSDKGLKHIHCHFSHIASDVGMYAAKICRIPFSFTAHANDIFERGYLLKEKSARAKFIATISIFNIKKLASLGINREKIKLVRCGVDSHTFSPRSRVRKERHEKIIGFLGRLVEKKGVDLLISAAEILIRQGHSVHLEVMGDGPLLSELQGIADSLSIADHITFGGPLSHTSVSSWFEKIDYFVFPGKIDSNGDMDGIPVVLMEAMMRGVPVIATNVSGIPELVRNGDTGRLVSPAAKDIAAAIDEAILDTDEQEAQKVTRAINLVQSEFNITENTRKLVEYFDIDAAPQICPTSLHS